MAYRVKVFALSVVVFGLVIYLGSLYGTLFRVVQEAQFDSDYRYAQLNTNVAPECPDVVMSYTRTAKTKEGGKGGNSACRNPNPPTLIVYETVPPSVPAGLFVVEKTCSRVTLAWSPSTDTGGSGLAGYFVYRNNVEIGIATSTMFTDTAVSAMTTYTYAVSAYDNYGNVSAKSTSKTVTTPGCLSWREDFNGSSLDSGRWVVSNKRAPGYIAGTHIGYFEPGKVAVAGGFVRLELTQENGTVDGNVNGIISRGGEIRTIGTYGYGAYEWQMKMSGTGNTPSSTGSSVPGSVSAGFNYVNNSQTEIDFEVEGDAGNKLYMTTWLNPDPAHDPVPSNHTVTSTIVSGMSSNFWNYKFVWSPGVVNFYVNNVLKATHTTNIPSVPANMFMNHWGSDWGGISTVGLYRYAFIDWVRYTAPGENPI